VKSWLLITAVVLAAMLGFGCTNPSTVGRFRATPMTSIILDDLGVVDEAPSTFAGARDPVPADLVPDRSEYVIGSGDVLELAIFELFSRCAEWAGRKQVSETGRITLPVIGTFPAAGRTELELTEDIKDYLSPHILKDPKVSVVVTGSLQKVYSISGPAVAQPGRYPLGESDFRIREALAQAGGIPQLNVSHAYVIREVNEEELEYSSWGTAQADESHGEMRPVGGMLAPGAGAGARVRSGSGRAEVAIPVEPVPAEAEPLTPEREEQELIESIKPMLLQSEGGQERSRDGLVSMEAEVLFAQVLEQGYVSATDGDGSDSEKPFKVIRQGSGFRVVPREGEASLLPPLAAEAGPQQSVGREPMRPPGEAVEGRRRGELTELGGLGQGYEVIRVDLKALLGGDLSQNIVVKAGDDIQVPLNSVGVFYVMGQVARPGPYSVTGDRMTIKQALAIVGPMTPLAVPSRCDIIRRVGENREVTYRMNLEKLFAGTAPDVFIKPGDIINIGSHPVAQWVAVVRNSFRATYGFGFVYDRNMADKDFGH